MDGHKGGICVAWIAGFHIQVLSLSPNRIHLKVKCSQLLDCLITRICGPPNVQDINNEGLQIPWMLTRDFNQVLAAEEKFQ